MLPNDMEFLDNAAAIVAHSSSAHRHARGAQNGCSPRHAVSRPLESVREGIGRVELRSRFCVNSRKHWQNLPRRTSRGRDPRACAERVARLLAGCPDRHLGGGQSHPLCRRESTRSRVDGLVVLRRLLLDEANELKTRSTQPPPAAQRRRAARAMRLRCCETHQL